MNGRVIQQVSIAQALGSTLVLPDVDAQDANILQQMLVLEAAGAGQSTAC